MKINLFLVGMCLLNMVASLSLGNDAWGWFVAATAWVYVTFLEWKHQYQGKMRNTN